MERRLAKLEGSLSPTEAVLAWLAEAHEYPTLPDYVASLLDAQTESWPLARIGSQVEAAVCGSLKGRPRDAVWKAVRRSVGDAFFLLELIIGINRAAEEICRFEGLRCALLTQWMRALTLEAELAGGRRVRGRASADGPSVREIDAWRAGLATALTTVYAEEAARSRLEERYLRGRPVLFPELVGEWEALRGRLEGRAVLADQVAVLRGSGSVPLALAELRATSVDATSTRTAELMEMARIGALDMLGENEQAARIVERRLRAVAEST